MFPPEREIVPEPIDRDPDARRCLEIQEDRVARTTPGYRETVTIAAVATERLVDVVVDDDVDGVAATMDGQPRI